MLSVSLVENTCHLVNETVRSPPCRLLWYARNIFEPISKQDAFKGVSVGCTNSQHKLSCYRELQPRVNFGKCTWRDYQKNKNNKRLFLIINATKFASENIEAL